MSRTAGGGATDRPRPGDGGDLLGSADFYHALAAGYDSDIAAERRAYLDAVDDLVCQGRSAPRRMLDIGCGPGVRGAALARRLGAERLWLADSSPGMVEIARERVPWARVELLDAADASECGRRLPGDFGLITCLGNVLGHMPGPARVATLRCLGGLLAPGGRIILDLNNRYNAAQYGLRAVAANIGRDTAGRGGGDYVTRRQVAGRSIATTVHLVTPLETRAMLRAAGRTVHRRWWVRYADGRLTRNPLAGQIVMEVE